MSARQPVTRQTRMAHRVPVTRRAPAARDAPRACPPPSVRGTTEDGRILLFTLGLVVVGLMLVGMVASATAVHLDDKRLYNLADLLAAAAADAAAPGRHLAALDANGPVLTDDTVARAVAEELAGYPFPEDLPADVRVVEARTPDGRTAQVTLAATSHPPLLAWFTRTFGEGFALSASSSARAVTGAP